MHFSCVLLLFIMLSRQFSMGIDLSGGDDLDPCSLNNLSWGRANPATRDMPHYQCKYPNGNPVFPSDGPSPVPSAHTCLGMANAEFGVPNDSVQQYCVGWTQPLMVLNPPIKPLTPVTPSIPLIPTKPSIPLHPFIIPYPAMPLTPPWQPINPYTPPPPPDPSDGGSNYGMLFLVAGVLVVLFFVFARPSTPAPPVPSV
jgi:hypothetical protein